MWSNPTAGNVWRKLNQQLHISGNRSFGESGTRIREETTPAAFGHKVTKIKIKLVKLQIKLFILVVISKEWEAGLGLKGTWQLRKTKKKKKSHVKELGFSFLTVSFQHGLEASLSVI